MHERPNVVDLFCGGGGFSEGFRRAGFDIVYAIDKAPGACETHELNQPGTETVQKDIADVEPGDLPDDIDVIIGSPPCTEFSMAKQGGGGDIDEGMRLVGEFLRFIINLEPDYWIMENVPRLEEFLPSTISFDQLPMVDSDEGQLDIPAIEVLNASEYGTPQRRNRLFSGSYPVPEPENKPAITMGDVQEHFPFPMDGPRENRTITDPIYDIELSETELSDHFYNSFLSERDAEEIRVRKEDHSFYGTMSFPDDSDEPARTVLATNRRVSRETLVMGELEPYDGLTRFRKPTVREVATIQGFPITYQFTGDSISKKWRRVGDAVPPTLSYRLAREIRRDMGLDTVEIERTERADLPTDLNNISFDEKRGRKLSISRQFRHHVPMDNIREFRVDLETDKEQSPPHPLADALNEAWCHPVAFRVHFYRGYGEDVEDTLVGLEESLAPLEIIDSERYRRVVADFLVDLEETFGDAVPDATTFQAVRSRRYEGDSLSPTIDYDILGDIDEIVNEHLDFFGASQWHITCSEFFDDEDVTIPGRVLLKLIAANYVAWKLNNGLGWIRANPTSWYQRDEWADDVDVKNLNLENELRAIELPDQQLTRLLEQRIRELGEGKAEI